MISVIIPVHNANDPLKLTLEGFTQQIDCPNFEIYVVDDGSYPKADNIVDEFRKVLNVNYLYEEHRGRSHARNAPRELITGSIVVFNDADRIPGPYFLREHYNSHESKTNALVIGTAKEIYFTNITEKKNEIFDVVKNDTRGAKIIPVHKTIYRIFNEDGKSDSNIPWIGTLTGNMSIRKVFLDDVDWFDEEFTDWGFEHFELGYRLYKREIQFYKQAKAINYHIAHSREQGSLFEAMNRSFGYFHNKHNKPEILSLMELMNGAITIQELDEIADIKNKKFREREVNPLYIKIRN